ncbi:hypothetical protein V8C42DRAFT_355341 [Trichoderma barbatum]
MSILFCCGFRRRGRQSEDADLAEPLEGHRLRRGLADIQRCFDQSRESVEMPIRSRDASMLPAELPSEDPTELGQLVVDDSDGEGEEGNPLTKTSSALNVVRTKLIRHISHENEPNRRSRASAGHSQEEVARRAELRRFRHQRIQEELKNEESNAESSSTSHRSTRYLSPLIDAGQPRIGPRDTIEFSVADGNHLSPTQPPPTHDSQLTKAHREGTCDSTQEKSVINPPVTPAVSGTESGDQVHPLRPPSTHSSTSQKLAGCSYNMPRLGRVLGTDNEFDIRHGAHAWEEQSALGIWLAAQGLQSRSSSVRPGDRETNDDANLGNQVSTPYADIGGIDSTADVLLPTHCQDNSKGEILDRKNSFKSASFVSSLSNARMQSEADVTSLGRNLLLETDALGIAIARPVDPSSSDYPSALPSFQPSPDRSQTNFHHLSAEDLESLELSPFSWKGKFSVIRSIQASEGMSSYATAEENIFYADIDASSAQINCPPVQASSDATSLACHETANSHQRETTMQAIGTRFGNVISRKKPSLNFGSRFREEFLTSSTGSGRRSLMAKMNLSVPRRSKYSSNSFGTAQSRHYSIERSPLDLGCETPNGMRLETPIGRPSPFTKQEGCFPPTDISPATLGRVHDCPKSLISRPSGAFEASRLTPHSELLLDESHNPSRRILQQWTTNIQETFSPISTPKCSQPPKPVNRLTKIPQLQPHVLQSFGERITNADPYQPEADRDGSLVVNVLPVESTSRFRPGKLGKAVKYGLKKLIPSHDNERQNKFFQIPENHRRHVENEKCLASKIVRTDTLTIASEHRKFAPKEAAEFGIATPKQHLSAEVALCHQPSSLKVDNPIDLERSKKAARIAVKLVAQKLADRPSQSHHGENGLMNDISTQPWRRLTFEEENDRNQERTDSASASSGIRAPRRWKSALDVPASRNLSSTWTGRSMAQSLSLSNLRA